MASSASTASGGRRSGEQVALAEVASELAQLRELPVGLDALGDGDEAERVGEAHEVGGDGRVLRVVLDALDEGQVDLDDVDREAAEVLERREPGAEVVERDADAVVVQLLRARRARARRAHLRRRSRSR